MTQQALPLSGRMKGRDWLMTQDWSDDEIELVLAAADQLKKEFKTGVQTIHLPHKTIFLIFLCDLPKQEMFICSFCRSEPELSMVSLIIQNSFFL